MPDQIIEQVNTSRQWESNGIFQLIPYADADVAKTITRSAIY